MASYVNTWFMVCIICLLQGTRILSKQTATSIYFLHIKSDIKYRFATTLVTSKVVNRDEVAREVVYDVTLPNEAFMTNFTLEINGDIYVGVVKEKEEAKQQYENAKARGQSAGHISAKPRNANKFNIAVNVEALGKVTFNLTYQEIVQKKIGKYKHVIYISPGQPVDDFQIEVAIQESRDITLLTVPSIRSDLLTNVHVDIGETNDIAVVQRPTSKTAYILYNPSLEEQTATSQEGLSGQFVVEYDVDRQTDAGDLLVMNGYFVHYFAFNDEPFPKDILFILDVSGSMEGKKIRQLREAMLHILDDIETNDRFNILTFDGRIKYWVEGELVQASKNNKNLAKPFIRGLRSGGMTDINKAMIEGLRLLSSRTDASRADVLIFLTDGQPTIGEVNLNKILENVLRFNEVAVPLFSLAFGKGADYELVRRMAAQNNGFGRKIYEDSDAALQIKGLYDEISTVLLKNITFTYLNTTVDAASVTKSRFNTFFAGSEIMVAGKVENTESNAISVSVTGLNQNGLIILNSANNIINSAIDLNLTQNQDFESITEKLWAYLTIKQRLNDKEASRTPEDQARIDKEILDLSLKYNFVTPLTSMVVTLPRTSDGDVLMDVSDTDRRAYNSRRKSPTTNRKRKVYKSKPMIPYSGSVLHSGRKRRRKSKTKRRKTTQTSASTKRKKTQHLKDVTAPTFIIKVDGIMEPLCVDIGLKAGRTYKILQHSLSGTLIYASTDYASRSTRQRRSVRPRHMKKNRRKVKRKKHVIVSRVVMETGGQSLNFLPTKYAIDGTETYWDIDTFALNIFNQNISYTIDVIPTNGSRHSGDEQLQIYSDIPSNTGLNGMLANFAGIRGTISNRKRKRGKLYAKLVVQKDQNVYNLRKVHKINNPSTVIGSCWSVKKNFVKSLGLRPQLYENGSVL